MNTSYNSSGCESGWTTYLDQNSNNSIDPYSKGLSYYTKYNVEDDDDDLSMLSDASSAPPHYQTYPLSEDMNTTTKTKTKTKKKSSSKTRKETNNNHNFCLDDTATSSVFHFSQDNVPHSDDHNSAGNVYSSTHIQDESRTKKGLNFFKSSTKGKSSGSLLGRKRQ